MKIFNRFMLILTTLLFLAALTSCDKTKDKIVFEEALPFSEDLGCVKVDGLYGFIDETGEFVIDPTYETSGYFMNDITVVKKDGFFGVIDKNNKEVIPFIYEDAQQTYTDLISVKKDGKYGCIDLNGKTVVDFISSESIIVSNHTPEHKIAIITGEDGKKGLIDLVTNFSIPTIYTDVNPWYDEENTVSLTLGGKYGFVNLDTQAIIEPFASSYIVFFNNGTYGNLTSITVNNKSGFINSQGEIVIEPIYNFASSFDENGLASIEINNKCGCINTKGELVIDAVYDYPFFFTNGLASVSIDGNPMIINTEGELVDIDPSTFCSKPPMDFSQNLDTPCIISYYFNDNGAEKAMALSPTGEILFKTTYDDIYPMTNGLYTVYNIGLMGCINERGIEILPPEYNQLNYIEDNLFIVAKGNKYGVIDTMRNELIPLEYDEILNTGGNLILIKLEEKWGYYNIKTKTLKDKLYDEVIAYNSYPIPVRKGEQWFYIDENGDVLFN